MHPRVFLVFSLLAAPAFADSDVPAAPPEGAAPAAEGAAPAADTDAVAAAPADESLLGALQLPLLANALRSSGIEENEVDEALDSARKHNVDAAGTADVFRRTMRQVREHGRIEAFGHFVNEQLEQGKRGQELAAAIKAEHEKRGRFHHAKPEGEGEEGEEKEHGKPEGAGEHGGKPEGEHGKPEGAGEHGGKPEGEHGGKPADAGKPADKGGKPTDKGGKPDHAGKEE